MAVIGFRSNAIDAANRSQLKVLRWATKVALGANSAADVRAAGAEYEQPNGVRWRIFSDLGIDLVDIANLATLCGGLASVPANWVDGLTRSEARDKVVTFVQSNRVWPVTIPEGTDDPVKYVADQQPNVPNWFAARQSIPPGLTPVEVT